MPFVRTACGGLRGQCAGSGTVHRQCAGTFGPAGPSKWPLGREPVIRFRWASPQGRASFEQGGGRGGRGFWTQNLVYQKWPDQIFPIVNFVFSHDGHFGLGSGGRGFWGRGPPPLGF